jgi:hypothetical protein
MAVKKSFLLRVDPALWTEIERIAQAELRSVNAQIEFMLRESLRRRGRTPTAATMTKSTEGDGDE